MKTIVETDLLNDIEVRVYPEDEPLVIIPGPDEEIVFLQTTTTLYGGLKLLRVSNVDIIEAFKDKLLPTADQGWHNSS